MYLQNNNSKIYINLTMSQELCAYKFYRDKIHTHIKFIFRNNFSDNIKMSFILRYYLKRWLVNIYIFSGTFIIEKLISTYT
jgi:hypothetical protein